MGDASRASADDLALQARSVAESILASPKIEASLNNPTLSSLMNQSHNQHQHQRHMNDPSGMLNDLSLGEDDDDDEDDGENSQLCNLFIGDLSRTVTEEQIRAVFSKCGEVVNVDVKRDKRTQNNLGYGFVQYATREQAVAAKEKLNGIEIGHRKVRIGWAQKNTTLFVGDLDGTISTDQLREMFGKFGELVEEETFVKAGSGRYGFVRFKHRQDAETAKMEMNKKLVGSRAIRIGWGDNNIQKHCAHVQFNPALAGHLEEVHLEKMFEPFGPVVSVSLPRYQNGKLKGYGFVHFEDSKEGEQAARKAIAALAETKVQQVPIRCSYGKRRGKFPTARPFGFRGMSEFQAGMGGIYATQAGGSTWLMSLGPDGGWHPVQLDGSSGEGMGMMGGMGMGMGMGMGVPGMVGGGNDGGNGGGSNGGVGGGNGQDGGGFNQMQNSYYQMPQVGWVLYPDYAGGDGSQQMSSGEDLMGQGMYSQQAFYPHAPMFIPQSEGFFMQGQGVENLSSPTNNGNGNNNGSGNTSTTTNTTTQQSNIIQQQPQQQQPQGRYNNGNFSMESPLFTSASSPYLYPFSYPYIDLSQSPSSHALDPSLGPGLASLSSPVNSPNSTNSSSAPQPAKKLANVGGLSGKGKATTGLSSSSSSSSSASSLAPGSSPGASSSSSNANAAASKSQSNKKKSQK